MASHPEWDSDTLYVIARSYPVLLHDDYRFASPSSPTGFAGGEIHLAEEFDCPRIKVSIYQRGTAAEPPPEAAPHTIRWNGESWSYGYLPADGGLPALPHELDHAIGMDHPILDETIGQGE